MAILIWLALWIAWSLVTRSAHSSTALAWTCTGILIAAYAVTFEAYRRWWSRRPPAVRVAYTALVLALATAIAVALILLCYGPLLGPYPARPWYENLALDYVGGVVHVGAAAVVLALVRRRRAATATGSR